jgi:hypothetical protein
VNSFIRLIPVMVACVATQAFASDPTTPTEPVKPAATAATTPAATTDTAASSTNPAPAAPQRLVLEDKTLSQTEVNRLLSQGYKPQKGRDDTVLYCRMEGVTGTHFEKKVCKSAEQLKTATQDSKDLTDKLQHNLGNPAGH